MKGLKEAKKLAMKFVIDNIENPSLQLFLQNMQNNPDLTHSYRWSLCYDFLEEHYPEATGTLVTGLTYFIEEGL